MMGIKQRILHLANRFGYHIERTGSDVAFPILRPLDRNGIEVLADKDFQQSCESLGDTTLLDTPRLANLWQLCRMTDPTGAMLEIGTFKGGGALHLSNCCPDREIIVCDPFDADSFEFIHPELDSLFKGGQFATTSQSSVEQLLKGKKATIIPGYFPASIGNHILPRLSFVHLDVDVYKATKDSLMFILNLQQLCPHSLIVFDDYNRSAQGVNQAVHEVVNEIPGTLALPLFPGQGVIIPKSWFS
jgi:hypothetical protein